MDDAIRIVALGGVLGAGLTGGVVFAFSNFIMQALGRMPSEQGMRAMQLINETVYNKLFMGGFVFTTLLSLGAVVVGVIRWGQPGSVWLAIGGVSFVLGVFLVTAACNVPRNERLKAVVAGSDGSEEMWTQYLRDWTRWNHVRTLASVVSVLGYGLALGGV